MGWISSVFVHKTLDAAVDLGCISPEIRLAQFQRAKIDPAAPINPKSMVTDSAFFDLLEFVDVAGALGSSVPIQIGASMRCDDYGAFGLAFKSAPDLLGSYSRVERFGKVVTSVANFRVVQSDGAVFMEVIQASDRRAGLVMTNALAVAAALALSREVSAGPVEPRAVHLTSDAPADLQIFDQHFQCPLHFGAARDAIELAPATVRRPNRLSDAGMSRFFEAHLDAELGRCIDRTPLARQVLEQISDTLSEGVPTLSDVAGRLGMSSRTLQRRLSDADLAYQDLVSEARQALSQHLLKQTDYALAEIAFLTGFSDQSTFTRAFKRWQGQTPASFRRDR